MIVNGKEYNIDKLVNEQKFSFMKKRENGLLLSDEDIANLERCGINYREYNDLKALLFAITAYLEDDDDELLEELSIKLGEYNYYNYTNK